MKPRTAISSSGGKDSYLALHRSQSACDIVAMITMTWGEQVMRSSFWAVDLEEADALRV